MLRLHGHGSTDRQMLAAIGETFETPLPTGDDKNPMPAQSDLVTGVICSARPMLSVSSGSGVRMLLTISYRINIWTRKAPDVSLLDTDALKSRILLIGNHFKVSVLGFSKDQKLVQGGLQTEVFFESHSDSEKKGNTKKLVV